MTTRCGRLLQVRLIGEYAATLAAGNLVVAKKGQAEALQAAGGKR
ncbi:hypothetical protein [Pseudomonas typographi]|nr:hypothetical protein [Pseudomonas typographi]